MKCNLFTNYISHWHSGEVCVSKIDMTPKLPLCDMVSLFRMGMLDCAEQCRHSDTALLAAFYLEGVALPLCGGLGILGNVLAILVLR